jgi:hypothetical protein
MGDTSGSVDEGGPAPPVAASGTAGAGPGGISACTLLKGGVINYP